MKCVGRTVQWLLTLVIEACCQHRKTQQKQVHVQPRNSVVNVTLPAFAAERRAGAPLLLLLGARRPPLSTPISHAGTALSSKFAAATCGGRMIGQTDRRTDARPFHRHRSAYYASNVNNIPVRRVTGSGCANITQRIIMDRHRSLE